MQKEYQICARCIMDMNTSGIEFDENGVCNYCKKYDKIVRKKLLPIPERERKLKEIITRIKQRGKNKEYNCIIGLSGGVDSSYAAYLAKKFGLRPLAVHLDNGWNSGIAIGNIKNIVKNLDFDLYNYAIDWEEFRDLQRSFFKASVVDIEVLTDHAITALLYRIADKRMIKYILTGCNFATEAVMPKSWSHRKSDLKNIKAIQKLFGTKKIKSFPTASTFKLAVYRYVKEIKSVNLLDYVPYIKEKAMATLKKELGWRSYGAKHFESIFTKFYQAYILPAKFHIDKRRTHYSNLIWSGQMTREEGLKAMEEQPYPANELEEDKEYVIKKLGFSEDEFEQIMKLPVKSHYDYSSDQGWYDATIKIKKLLKIIKKDWKRLS